jgi:hypothetical protein
MIPFEAPRTALGTRGAQSRFLQAIVFGDTEAFATEIFVDHTEIVVPILGGRLSVSGLLRATTEPPWIRCDTWP